MTISLSPDLEELVRRKVGTGDYHDANDVVREALRLMDERDRLKRLREALAVGMAQAERGEVIALTPAVWDEIERDADEADRLGLPIDPDVCP